MESVSSPHANELVALHARQRDRLFDVFTALHGEEMAEEQRLRDDHPEALVASFAMASGRSRATQRVNFDHADAEKSQVQYGRGIRGFFEEGLFLSWTFLRMLASASVILSTAVGIGCFCAFYFTGTQSDIQLPIFSFAIAFPVSFGLRFVLFRRDSALKDISAVKANTLLVYMGCRDFVPAGVDEIARRDMLEQVKHALSLLLITIRQKLNHQTTKESGVLVYRSYDNVSLRVRDLLHLDAQFRKGPLGNQIMSRVDGLGAALERALLVHDYRSVSALRAFCVVFVSLNSAFLAPLFSKIALEFGIWIGFTLAVVSSVTYSLLIGLFLNLDDPFDGSAIDDIELIRLGTHSNFFGP